MTSEMTDEKAGKICFVLGTRPEFIKVAPIIRLCDRRGIPYIIIHTGQHYSEKLNSVFFEQLDLSEPTYELQVGSKPQGKQTGEMIRKIEEILINENLNCVLVQGDTNSVLAGAIATSKLSVDLGHIEAGLRSFNHDMAEETNRVLTDHASDYLFAPTSQSKENLINEGLPDGRIFVTGNTIVDAVYEHKEFAARKSQILDEVGVEASSYALITLHRAENVDNRSRFKTLLRGIDDITDQYQLEGLYPIHPRARQRLTDFGIEVPEGITLLDPQDYLDFLQLEQNSKIILTDSGGVQEEACILGVPCVTLREETERPETIDVGANIVAGTEPPQVLKAVQEMISKNENWENPFGDGNTSEKIISVLQSHQNDE